MKGDEAARELLQQVIESLPAGNDAPGQVTPTEAEKHAWSLMAIAAYNAGRNDVGARMSVAAAMRRGESCNVRWFDARQAEHRAWLVFGKWAPLAVQR